MEPDESRVIRHTRRPAADRHKSPGAVRPSKQQSGGGTPTLPRSCADRAPSLSWRCLPAVVKRLAESGLST